MIAKIVVVFVHKEFLNEHKWDSGLSIEPIRLCIPYSFNLAYTYTYRHLFSKAQHIPDNSTADENDKDNRRG